MDDIATEETAFVQEDVLAVIKEVRSPSHCAGNRAEKGGAACC